MNLLGRSRLVHAALVASLLLNGSMLVYLAGTGGLRRFLVRLDLLEQTPERQPFQEEMDARYRLYPNRTAGVVFAGDSQIANGPWAEFFSEIHNRGIGFETTARFLKRLDEITEDKPRRVFLLLGANDLSTAVPLSQFVRHYRTILERIRQDCPATTIHVLGVLPVNRTFPVPPIFDNDQVVEANQRLEGLVSEFPGVRFLDLGRYLRDESGGLRGEFTTDGLHLNTAGYLAIRNPLQALMTENDDRKADQAAEESNHP